MSIHILDASAITAHLNAEAGADVVDSLLTDPNALCYAHSVNLCEVYYDIVRKSNSQQAIVIIRSLYDDGLIERRDMNRRFWHRVGDLKARGKISIADCFCIVLAQELGGEVVTSDHHEFDALVPLNIVPFHFIR